MDNSQLTPSVGQHSTHSYKINSQQGRNRNYSIGYLPKIAEEDKNNSNNFYNQQPQQPQYFYQQTKARLPQPQFRQQQVPQLQAYSRQNQQPLSQQNNFQRNPAAHYQQGFKQYTGSVQRDTLPVSYNKAWNSYVEPPPPTLLRRSVPQNMNSNPGNGYVTSSSGYVPSPQQGVMIPSNPQQQQQQTLIPSSPYDSSPYSTSPYSPSSPSQKTYSVSPSQLNNVSYISKSMSDPNIINTLNNPAYDKAPYQGSPLSYAPQQQYASSLPRDGGYYPYHRDILNATNDTALSNYTVKYDSGVVHQYPPPDYSNPPPEYREVQQEYYVKKNGSVYPEQASAYLPVSQNIQQPSYDPSQQQVPQQLVQQQPQQQMQPQQPFETSQNSAHLQPPYSQMLNHIATKHSTNHKYDMLPHLQQSVLQPGEAPPYSTYRSQDLDSPQGSPLPVQQQTSPGVFKTPQGTPPIQRKQGPARQLSNEVYNLDSPSSQLLLQDMSLDSPRPRSETVEMDPQGLLPRSPVLNQKNQNQVDSVLKQYAIAQQKLMPPPSQIPIAYQTVIQTAHSLNHQQQQSVQPNVNQRLRSGTVEMTETTTPVNNQRADAQTVNQLMPPPAPVTSKHALNIPAQRGRAGTVEMADSSDSSALVLPEMRIRSGTVEMSETAPKTYYEERSSLNNNQPPPPSYSTDVGAVYPPRSPQDVYSSSQYIETYQQNLVVGSSSQKSLSQPQSSQQVVSQPQIKGQQQQQQHPSLQQQEPHQQQQQQTSPLVHYSSQQTSQQRQPVINGQGQQQQSSHAPSSQIDSRYQAPSPQSSLPSPQAYIPRPDLTPKNDTSLSSGQDRITNDTKHYKSSQQQIYEQQQQPVHQSQQQQQQQQQQRQHNNTTPDGQKYQQVNLKQEENIGHLSDQELERQQKMMQQQYVQRVRQAQLQQQLREIQSEYETNLQLEQDIAQEFLWEQDSTQKRQYLNSNLQYQLPQQSYQQKQPLPPRQLNYDPSLGGQYVSQLQQMPPPLLSYSNKDAAVFPVTGLPINQSGYPPRMPPQQRSMTPAQPIVIMPGGGSFSNPGQFVPTSGMPLPPRKDQRGPPDAGNNFQARPPTKQQTPFQRLRKIAEDISSFVDDVVKFNGKKGDHEYKYLEEMLTQQLLLLDKVPANTNDELRNARKSLVKEVQELLEILERRSTSKTVD